MPVVKRSETTKALNLRMQLPENTRVAIQCMKEEFAESKNSGNFHIHREWQVIDHPEIIINSQEIDLKGTELDEYVTTKWSDGNGGFLPPSDSKVRKGLGRAYESYDKIGKPLPEEGFDTDNPPLVAKGMVVEAVLKSEQQQVTNPPSEEDIAAGRKRGSAKVDSDGKPVYIFLPKIAYIIGPSEVKPIVAPY